MAPNQPNSKATKIKTSSTVSECVALLESVQLVSVCLGEGARWPQRWCQPRALATDRDKQQLGSGVCKQRRGHSASILIPPIGRHLTMASTCRLQNTRTNKYGPFLEDFELPPALPEEMFDGSLRSVKEYLSGENTEHREVSFRGQRDGPVSQARTLSFVLFPASSQCFRKFVFSLAAISK